MCPIRPRDDKADHPTRDVKLVSDRLLRQAAACVYLPDSQHIDLCEFDHSVPSAFGVRPVTDFVGLVLLVRNPAKVFSTVIEAIAIPVGCLMALRRPWAMERRAYRHMHIHSVKFPKGHAGIKAHYLRPQYDASTEAPSSIGNLDPAIQRTHAPKARSLIARMSRYWTPFLRLGYRGLSHVALLQRVGQGMTEGCNQPSFPHCSDVFVGSQGISILTSRV